MAQALRIMAQRMFGRNATTENPDEDSIDQLEIDRPVPEMEKELDPNEAKVRKAITTKIHEELILLPPLLPFKFGNGLFIQYISNSSGIDDKVGILEVGLSLGLTSLGLYFLGVVSTYLKGYLDNLEEESKSVFGVFKKLISYLHFAVFNIQVLLLIILFLYCSFQYSVIDSSDPSSPKYVKTSIFTFSIVVSSMMFFSVLVGAIILVYLKFKTPRNNTDINIVHRVSGQMTPAMQLMPLGLANLLINLYVLSPVGEDEINSKVFLPQLALAEGSVTMLLFSLISVGKIAMLLALRDGYLDYDEKKALDILKMFQYVTTVIQLLGFIVMFAHSLVVLSMGWKCPKNILIACLVISTLIVVIFVFGALLFLVLKCMARKKSQTI